jgi:glycosyltransferase involved in cell wall biosynthesis
MAALIRSFQARTSSFGAGWIANDAFCFLRLEHLHNSNYLTGGFMLAELLRKRRVGYVHVYGSTYPALRALVVHRLLGVPYSVSTFVDFDYPTPFQMLDEKFGAARFVVACTDFCAGRLVERYPGLRARFRVLRHALPSDYASAARLRPRDGRSRLVYVGRFVPKKGLDTLLRACRILEDRGVEFSCHLHGAGIDEGRLQHLARELGLCDKVFFEGAIPNERFYTTLNHDDVFVCSSRYMEDGERDGIPVTLLEAMAAGVTVVATRVSGIPELIVDGHNGFLVPPDDPVRLAGLLDSLLESPGKRAAVAAAAIRTVREDFSLDRAVELLDAWITRESGLEAGTAATGRHAVAEHA